MLAPELVVLMFLRHIATTGLLVIGVLAAPAQGQQWRTISPSPIIDCPPVVFDPALGTTLLLDVENRQTRAWTGQAWALIDDEGPTGNSAAMAFDDARGRVVVFVGSTGETWERIGSTWVLVSTTGPSVRWDTRLAYDPVGARTLLHGGTLSFVGPAFGDTWSWDGNNWTLVSSSGPALGSMAMAFDPGRGAVTAFGGSAGLATPDSLDTYEWNGTSWTLVPTIQAPSSGIGSLAYDPVQGRLLAFMRSGALFAAHETWERTANGWSLLLAGPLPFTVAFSSIAYDPGRAEFFGVHQQQTWTFDGTGWSQRQAVPKFESGGAAVYDSQRDVVLYGRASSDPADQSTFEWDGVEFAEVASGAPMNLLDAAMAYDSVRDRTVLFGGRNGLLVQSGTWEWDGAVWTQVAVTGPPAQARVQMVFDEARGVAVLVARLRETWTWDGAVWTRVSTSGPTTRLHYGVAYDRARDRVVVFGGLILPSGRGADTWEWDGSAWTQFAPTGSGPSARAFCQLEYDEARGRVVLYGGEDVSDVELADTWEWDGRRWIEVQVTGNVATKDHQLVYSDSLDRVLMIGPQGGRVDALQTSRFGSACAGSVGVPQLAVDDDRPALGSNFDLSLTNAPPQQPVLHFVGLFVAPTPPIQLDALGMPGCEFLLDGVLFLASQSTGMAGTASLPVTMSTAPVFVGLPLGFQAFVVDPAANALGLITSNGVVVSAR